MLMPKRTKYRKPFRPRKNRGKAQRGTDINFGEYGLQVIEPAWISARQLESGRRAITNYLRRGGKVWIRVFPDRVITQKPAETRMGSGKGAPEYWVAVVKPGRMLYEIEGVTEEQAREAFGLAAAKLPVETTFVKRLVL